MSIKYIPSSVGAVVYTYQPTVETATGVSAGATTDITTLLRKIIIVVVLADIMRDMPSIVKPFFLNIIMRVLADP